MAGSMCCTCSGKQIQLLAAMCLASYFITFACACKAVEVTPKACLLCKGSCTCCLLFGFSLLAARVLLVVFHCIAIGQLYETYPQLASCMICLVLCHRFDVCRVTGH